jgi:hypothetical protein
MLQNKIDGITNFIDYVTWAKVIKSIKKQNQYCYKINKINGITNFIDCVT